MRIAIRDVSKRYGAFSALDRVTLEIASGELVALLGPSGSGKTTLLRMIAGLDWPDEGAILFDGENALTHSIRERQVGFVFQHYALFRHMSVHENVAFGLRAKPRRERRGEAEIRARVGELLDLVQLGPLARRYPSQLSGGQRQRVALARALAIEPRVLLLDEPFGALDAKVRKELRRWLRNLHDEIDVTSVFVTHDQAEAMEVADRVVIVNKGRIEQIGTPQQVYDHPQTAFVHEFIGESAILPVAVAGGRVTFAGRPVALESQGVRDGAARLFVRPYRVRIVAENDSAGLAGRVIRVTDLGPQRRVEITVGDAEDGALIEIDAPRGQELQPGQQVGLRPEQYRLFAA